MNTDDILQRCLENVAAGHLTPAQCAEQFPHVPELHDNLLAAQVLMAWPPPTLSPAAVQRHKAQLRTALAARRQPARRPVFALPRWALAAVLVLVLVLSGAGTVSAAARSLPGQALYPVKRAVEAVQETLTPAAAQAAWHVSQAEARTDELAALAAHGEAEAALLNSTAAEIGAETEIALDNLHLAPPADQAPLLERLLAQIERQQAVLMALSDRLPDQAQAGIDRALTVSRSQRLAALARLSSLKQPNGQTATQTPVAVDTRVAPGQAKKTATALAGPTDLPPGQVRRTATAEAGPTDLPPGQARRTATAQAGPTATPPGNAGGQGSGGQPNCNSNNPNSNNYCTPVPEGDLGAAEPPPATPTAPSSAGEGEATVQPSCTASSPNSPNYCTPTPAPQGDGGGAPGPAEQPTACPLNPAGNPVCSNRP